MKLYIPVIVIILILIGSIGIVSAQSNDDLTVIGISTTDNSSIRLGIEPGVANSISFSNVTWYIYGNGEINESVDSNVTAVHQVEGLLIVSSEYEPGRHNVVFSSDSLRQSFVLSVSGSASDIDWDEFVVKDSKIADHSEIYVWLVSIGSFLMPLPFVYRRIRRIKRSEVMRIV